MESNASRPIAAPSSDPLDWPRESGLSEKLHAEIREQRRLRRRRVGRRVKAGVAAGGLTILIGWLIPFLKSTESVVTASAQRSTVALPDGSTVELNAHTVVRTDFRYGRRQVRVEQGEAYFSVAPDRAHPFTVRTPAGVIEVLGTEFNVRTTDTSSFEVTLTQGSVVVVPTGGGGSPVQLSAGSQATVTAGSAVQRQMTESDLERMTAWRSGVIVLKGLTLAEAAGQYAAYHGCVIRVDPDISGLRLGGNGNLTQLPQFFSSLEEVLPVKTLRGGDGSYQLSRR